MSEYKTCTKCKSTKLLAEFGKHNGAKSAKSGLRASCKKCEVIAARLYQINNCEKVRKSKRDWAAKNPDKKKIYDQRYQIKNSAKLQEYHRNYQRININKIREYKANLPEFKKEQKRAADRIYGQNNRDKTRANSRRYRLNNPEQASANSRKYRQANRPLMAIKSAARRAKKLENGVFFISRKEVNALYARPCFYCASILNIEIDHIVPIAKGGRHSIGNLVPACRACNASKSDKFLTEWKLWKTNG